MKNVRIYGDSVMKGILLDNKTKKYTVALPENIKRIERRFGLKICNNSIMGCTITKGSRNLTYDADHDFDCDTVLLEYGGNDCDFDWKSIAENPEGVYEPKTRLCDFTSKYEQLVELIKAHGAKPVLMTLPPIHSEKYFGWITRDGLSRQNILTWLGDIELIYRHQELYSDAIVKVAMKTGALLVDVRSYFLDHRDSASLLCDDGIHPNASGHKLIYRAFYDELESATATVRQA